MARLSKFKIMARGRVKLYLIDGDGLEIRRTSARRAAEAIRQACSLDPTALPEGAEVSIGEDGTVTTRNALGIYEPTGRKPRGERPMTGAERQRAYMARLREK